MIASGRLRHRLALEEAVTADDGSGGFTTSWVEIATLWGAIETLTGREFGAADAVKGEARHRIIIRYRDDVGPAKRFRFYARAFEIASIADPDGRRQRLVCYCIERDLG